MIRTVIFALTLISVIPCADGQSLASAEKMDPRDIEQVYTRPPNTKSWASTFRTITGRDDQSKSIAIVIGLSDYSRGWKHLEAPWYDARRVRDFLIKSGFDYVVTLTNKSASKEKIRHYMEDELPQKVGENDRFIFYFSGHGSQRKLFNIVRGYLPMIDSSQDDWSTMISMDEIDQWSKNIGQTRHSLFVLDSCFSGLAGVESKGSELSNVYIEDLLKPGHFLITAGSQGQESYASLKQWGGSLFTDTFLKGIAGAADSGSKEFPANGVITLTKLYDYIRNRVSRERDRIPQIDQTPLLSDLTPKSLGEFFFFASDGEVHAKFAGDSGTTEPVASNRAVPSAPKGLIASTDESASVKVDQLYKDGLTDFPKWQFGKTVSELTPYTWEQLPKAGEFPRDEIRYLWVKITAAGTSLKDYGCISPTSNFVFFFEPHAHKLFRISIRFYDEGVCPRHDLWLSHFANSIGTPIQSLDSAKFFQVTGNDIELLGVSISDPPEPHTVIDLVSAKYSSLMTGVEWLTWLMPKPK